MLVVLVADEELLPVKKDVMDLTECFAWVLVPPRSFNFADAAGLGPLVIAVLGNQLLVVCSLEFDLPSALPLFLSLWCCC